MDKDQGRNIVAHRGEGKNCFGGNFSERVGDNNKKGVKKRKNTRKSSRERSEQTNFEEKKP